MKKKELNKGILGFALWDYEGIKTQASTVCVDCYPKMKKNALRRGIPSGDPITKDRLEDDFGYKKNAPWNKGRAVDDTYTCIKCGKIIYRATGRLYNGKTANSDMVAQMNKGALIRILYLTMDMINLRLGKQIAFEEANCYIQCFDMCKRLLTNNVVSDETANYFECHRIKYLHKNNQDHEDYLKQYPQLIEFYRQDRELSCDRDRLTWINPEASLKPSDAVEDSQREVVSA